MAMQAAELSVQTSDTALLSCLMLYCSHTDEDWEDSWCMMQRWTIFAQNLQIIATLPNSITQALIFENESCEWQLFV